MQLEEKEQKDQSKPKQEENQNDSVAFEARYLDQSIGTNHSHIHNDGLQKDKWRNQSSEQRIDRTPEKQLSEQEEEGESGESSNSDSSQGDNWQQQITINEDTVNQILTVHLRPGQSIYHRGQVIISNRPLNTDRHQNVFDLAKIMESIRFRMSPPVRIRNTQRSIAYYCIRRAGGGGKILHLSEVVYGETFIIDFFKLLTINCSPDHYNIHPCFGTSKLYQIRFKDNVQVNAAEGQIDNRANLWKKGQKNLEITLQTTPGSIIVEKCLGVGEKFYTRFSSLLAISQNLEVKKQGAEGACLIGPGYVFMESSGNPYQNNAINPARYFMLCFCVVLFFSLFAENV